MKENPKEEQMVDPAMKEDEETKDWKVLSTCNVHQTSSIVTIAQNNSKEFCFVMKPAPGTRRTDIMAFNFIPEIEKMTFVSNYHVLVKFKYGKTVTFEANGEIV